MSEKKHIQKKKKKVYLTDDNYHVEGLNRRQKSLELSDRDKLIIASLYKGILFDPTPVINRYIANLVNADVFIERQRLNFYSVWKTSMSKMAVVILDKEENATLTIIKKVWRTLVDEIDLKRLGLPDSCLTYTQYTIPRLIFLEAYFPGNELVCYYITCHNLYHNVVCNKPQQAAEEETEESKYYEEMYEQYFGFSRMRSAFGEKTTGVCRLCDDMFMKELIYLMCVRFDIGVKTVLANRSNEIYTTIINALESAHKEFEESDYAKNMANATKVKTAKYKRQKTADASIVNYQVTASAVNATANAVSTNAHAINGVHKTNGISHDHNMDDDSISESSSETTGEATAFKILTEEVPEDYGDYVATHFVLCNDLANMAFSNVPMFVLHEDMHVNHKEMMYDLIMCIPYMLNRPKLLIHQIIRMYSTITIWDNRVLPMSYEGLYIYIQTMTTTHLRMSLESVYEDASTCAFDIDSVTTKLKPNQYLYDQVNTQIIIIENKK